MPQSILEMAKDLVMAQIKANQMPPEHMQQALQQTYASLMALKSQEETGTASTVETPEAPPEPVDWRKSITRQAITCLECGARYKQLSVRHLREHGLDGRSYRDQYGIPRTQPLAARESTARRRKIVQATKPWEKSPTYGKAQEDKMAVAKKSGKVRERVATAEG